MDDCIFCKIVRSEVPSKKVYEDDNFIVVHDIKPKADGHSLIISKKHYKTILDIPVTQGNEMLEAIKTISLDLINNKKAEAVNVVSNVGEASGQIIHHAHFHIIPRKIGDGLKSMA